MLNLDLAIPIWKANPKKKKKKIKGKHSEIEQLINKQIFLSKLEVRPLSLMISIVIQLAILGAASPHRTSISIRTAGTSFLNISIWNK